MLNEEKKESVICHDMDIMTCHDICHDLNNTAYNHGMIDADNFSKNVNNEKLPKSEWYYLTQILDSWRVYNPRAVVKKNPALAWRIMNLCKDPAVRVPGAYFTKCFRSALAELEAQKAQEQRTEAQKQEFEREKEKIKAILLSGRQKLGIIKKMGA